MFGVYMCVYGECIGVYMCICVYGDYVYVSGSVGVYVSVLGCVRVHV